MTVSTAVSTQYTNVTDMHSIARQKPRDAMHDAAFAAVRQLGVWPLAAFALVRQRETCDRQTDRQ